jgi:hypothetical protein
MPDTTMFSARSGLSVTETSSPAAAFADSVVRHTQNVRSIRNVESKATIG